MTEIKIVAICALSAIAVLMAGTLAVLTTQKTIGGSGSIKGLDIGVYWDLECTNATIFISFGQLEPGSSKSYALYLKNEGNSLLTLNMTTESWSPAFASDYLTLNWNLEGVEIGAQEVAEFSLNLSVSPEVSGVEQFTMDIVISGHG